MKKGCTEVNNYLQEHQHSDVTKYSNQKKNQKQKQKKTRIGIGTRFKNILRYEGLFWLHRLNYIDLLPVNNSAIAMC